MVAAAKGRRGRPSKKDKEDMPDDDDMMDDILYHGGEREGDEMGEGGEEVGGVIRGGGGGGCFVSSNGVRGVCSRCFPQERGSQHAAWHVWSGYNRACCSACGSSTIGALLPDW